MIIRTIIMYIFVIAAIRIMGKRQVGDLQPSELVITILISEIASLPLQDTSQPILTGVFSIFTLVSIEVIMSYVFMKFNICRKIFYGNSAIIIKDGKIDQEIMKKLRITVPDLMEVLRCNNFFNIEDVDYAILETNGQLSVLSKQNKKTVALQDMGIKTNDKSYPYLLVSDGKIIKETLKKSNIKEQDVFNKLKEKNLRIDDVLLLTADKYKNFTIVKKEKK